MALSYASAVALLPPPPHEAGTSRRHRRAHLQPAPASAASRLAPHQPPTTHAKALVAGVEEDHRIEQWWWDDATVARLLHRMSAYDSPLLLGTPSLAVAAHAAKLPHTLLDLDERFAFLPSYRRFDLHRPEPPPGPLAAHDAVFCDPPFSNLALDQLRVALDALGCSAANLFIAYNARREAELLHALAPWQLAREHPLGYRSVSRRTQRHLFLYATKSCTGEHLAG